MYGKADTEPKTSRGSLSKSRGRNKTAENPFTLYNNQRSPRVGNWKAGLNHNKSTALIKHAKNNKEVSITTHYFKLIYF